MESRVDDGVLVSTELLNWPPSSTRHIPAIR